jgi:16S rRNA processing protein RimM
MSSIFLGRIVKAFGIRGELKFHPSDDFWENVLESKNLTLLERADGKPSERALEVKTSRPHGGNYVVTLEGIDDRNAAEAVVGSEVFIEEDQIDVELPDEPLPYQLVGMNVRSESGEGLGEISSVIYSSAHAVYEITGPKGTFLVPAVPEFVVSLDEVTSTMVLRLMPGLIEE